MTMDERGDFDQCLMHYDYFFRPDLLDGKVALITGGGSGICFIIAEVFMRHKCSTVIVGRKFDRLKKAAQKLEKCTGQRCLPVKMDVRKVDEVEAGVDAALKQFSRIDILVNGAAGNFLCPASSLSYNGIKTVIDIDTLGTFNVCKAVYKSYFQEHGGSIINISATLDRRGTPLQCHAGAAKAAVDAITRHLAVEWGPLGIRVNGIAPGAIRNTEGMRRLGGKRSTEDFTENIPLQRLGESRDIADAAVFLASNASSYITGTVMIVDGGSYLTSGTSMARINKMMSKL